MRTASAERRLSLRWHRSKDATRSPRQPGRREKRSSASRVQLPAAPCTSDTQCHWNTPRRLLRKLQSCNADRCERPRLTSQFERLTINEAIHKEKWEGRGRVVEAKPHMWALLLGDVVPRYHHRVVWALSVSPSLGKSSNTAYAQRPTRRTSSWKRASEQRATNLGFTFKKMGGLDCSSHAFLSHAKAPSLSFRPVQARAKT
jgi:hypothetical protein